MTSPDPHDGSEARPPAPLATPVLPATTPPPLDYRPRKVLFVAVAAALLLVVVSSIVGARLMQYDTGVYFRVSDQIAIVCSGIVLACGALLFTRMRIRADENGVRIHNIVATHELSWDEVLRVSFPEGAPWGRLEIPDDEYVAVMAIQAADKHRAVEALRALRALHRAHAPYVAPHPAERGTP